MKRYLSMLLAIIMVLSMTGVAEDGNINGDAITAKSSIAADESLSPNEIAIDDSEIDVGTEIEAAPEEIGDLELQLVDGLLELEAPSDSTDVSAPGETESPDETASPDEALPPEEEAADSVDPTNAKKNTTFPSKLTLGKGETYDFGIKDATITSNKTSIVSVDKKKGIIKAEGTGSAKVTVKSGGKKIGTCKVTVQGSPRQVTLTGSLTLAEGMTGTVTATALDQEGKTCSTTFT